MARNPNPPWSDLPPELLPTISKFLTSNPLDILRFRSVCKSWYNSISSSSPPPPPPPHNHLLSPHFPLKIPNPNPNLSPSFPSPRQFYLLSVTSVYALRPPLGVSPDHVSTSFTPNSWIAFVDQINPGKFTLRFPFSKRNHVLPLDFPRFLNLLDFSVSEIGRFYNLSYVYNHRNDGRVIKASDWSRDVHKVVVFSNGLGVVALFHEGKLGLLRLGGSGSGSSSQWEVVHDGKGFRFDDIVDYKGRIIGVDRRGRVYEMSYDSSELKVVRIVVTAGGGRRKRLIESLGLLYLVVRCNSNRKAEKMGKFRVYVLNERRKWVEVTSISDRIFFFGVDFSFSVSAQEFEGLFGKNCIIFSVSSFWEYVGRGNDYWLMKSIPDVDALGIGVYRLEDGARLHAIEEYPAYCNILWPPPTWLWRDCWSRVYGILGVAISRSLLQSSDEELEAFTELSRVTKKLLDADELNLQEVHNTLKMGNMWKKFFNELLAVIEKEMKRIMENLNAAPPHNVSISLPNQDGTSNPQANGESWIRGEMIRRVGVHIKLLVSIKKLIQFLEESIDFLKSGQQDLGSAGEEKMLSKGT